MAYINDLFKIIITDLPYRWITDWAESYRTFTTDIAILKGRISNKPEMNFSDPDLYRDIDTF